MDFYSGAASSPGRFSEGLLLRRLHDLLFLVDASSVHGGHAAWAQVEKFQFFPKVFDPLSRHALLPVYG